MNYHKEHKVSVTKANPLKTTGPLAGMSLSSQNPLQDWDQGDVFIKGSVMVPKNVSLRKPNLVINIYNIFFWMRSAGAL